MIRVLRFSLSRLALGYVALSVLALCLFAVPLWSAWRTNLSTFKAYVHGEEMQRLVEVFDREGAKGLTAAMESQAESLPGGEIMILADPSKLRLAGNLPAWPAQVPDAPGIYGLVIDIGGGATMRVVVSHARLPGGYHLLLGRESVLFQSFIERFWYGIAGAMALVLVLGAAIGWLIRRALLSEVHEISRTASAIVEGDLSRRLEARSGSPELDTLARTVNGMLAQLGRQNVQLEGEVAVRRQAQQALHRAHDELEGVVAQRTAELARANESLQRSEERYARAVEASDEGHWDLNVATGEIFVSARMNEIFGFAPDTRFAGHAEYVARAPFHPDDRQRVLDTVQALLAGGSERYEIEYRVVPRSGEIRWVRSRAKAFQDDRGAVSRMAGSLTDITERKHAEEALRRSEERFALAVAGSTDGIWDWDLLTDEMFFSERAQRLYGLEPGPTVRRRTEWRTAVALHPDDAEGQRTAVEDYLAGRAHAYDGEWRVRHADGTYRWIRIRGLCVRDDAGRAIRMAGSVSDIDKQKSAEDALRLSEQRYERAMLASEAGFWEWTAATDHFYASPRLLEMGGFPPGTTFAGRSDSLSRTPYHPEDLARWNEATAAAFAGKRDRVEMEMRVRRSGETRWVHLNGLCTRDATGRVLRWTGSAIDITERKQAEAALRLSEERYARAMEGSDAGHWDWNIVTDEMFVSERAREMLALPAGAPPGRRSEVMALVSMHPDDRATMAAQVNAGIRSGIYERDYRVLPRPGEVRWLRSRGRVYHDAYGAAVRMTGSLTDITERKLSSDALRASEERYSLAMEASEEGYVYADLDTGDFVTSERLNEIFGIAPGTRFTGRRDFLSQFRFYDGDGELYQQAIRAIEADRGTDRYQFEFRIVLPSGEVRWIWTRGKVTRDAEGRPRRRVGVFSDITARKLAEEALRASEERYSLAMEASEEAHFDVNIDTDELFSSERLNEIYGFPAGTRILKRSEYLKDFGFYGNDAEIYHAGIRAAEAKGGPERYEFEYRIRRSSGEVRWLRTRGKVTRDAEGRARRRTGMVADITEAKLAAEALRTSEERFRALAESALAGIYLIQESRFRYVNPAMATMFGYTPEELVDRLGPADLVHPDDRALVAGNIRRRVEGKVDEIRYEFRGVRRDGSVFPVEVHGRRIEFGGMPGVMGTLVDNTERKRAVDELRESEARFRVLTGLSSDWYWEQDENLRFTYLSSQADALTGYPGGSSYGKTRWELASTTPLSCSWPEHQAVLAARQPFRDLEMRRVWPDGTVRYFGVSGTPMFDEQGRFKGYQGTGRDITERKRIEEELRSRQEMLEVALRDVKASEAELRSIVDAIPMQVWCALPDGSTEFQNRRYLDFAGQGADEARGFGWSNAIHPEDVEAYMARWQEIQASQAAGEAEARFRRFDGEYRSTLMRVAPVHDERGRVVKWYGANTDIEDRKRAEALLAGEKALLEMIAKGTPLGQILETLCRFVEENAAGCVCGIMLVDPSGMRLAHGAAPSLPASYNDGIHGRRVGPHSGPCAMAAFLKEQVISADIAAETRWREDDWCAHALAHGLRACWSTPIVSSAERTLGTFALYFREPRITASQDLGLMERLTHLASIAIERTQAEQALRRSETALRQAQRLEAMGTLAGGIAHDFNNILGAILGYGEMALRGVPKGSRLRRDLGSIMTAGERGRALVERILAFSRSGVGERVAVHVEKVVGEALGLLAANLPEGVDIERRLRAGRAAALGDPTQVHQVLMNLATNAIQAMPSGGTLRVSLEGVRLGGAHVATTGTLGAGDYVVLGIADSGTGMSPEILERIFDPFFTTKEVGVGTGLGLSLVHGIVTELGGAIDVASAVGEGSVFTVYLPRAGDAGDELEGEEPDVPRGNHERVLIVDDEAPLVTLATETLAELGYVPLGFTSSAAALEVFRADPGRFDAVITDERMPGMSGSALIREIRGVRRAIPILLVSGYVGDAVVQRALESGADEVLKKPLSARELATSLARLLHARQVELR